MKLRKRNQNAPDDVANGKCGDNCNENRRSQPSIRMTMRRDCENIETLVEERNLKK
jgi:hypothetical protein